MDDNTAQGERSSARHSVTLVMPNYNHAAFLERSLTALFKQTVPADEIIIVDDASTDDSLWHIERLTEGRPQVRIVRKAERTGAISAINVGLIEATGDLIAFPSADDLLFPRFIERLEPLLRENPSAAFACASVEIHDENDRVTGRRPILWPTLRAEYLNAAQASRQLEHGDNFFLGAATLYRRIVLNEAGGFVQALASLADGMLQRELAVRHGFCFAPDTLAVWRHHASNYSITSVTQPENVEALVRAAAVRISDSPPGTFPSGYADLFERRLRFNAARLVVLADLPPSDKVTRVAAIAQQNSLETSALAWLYWLGWPGRTMIMAWLTLRLCPFSFAWLAMEPLRRWWARWRGLG